MVETAQSTQKMTRKNTSKRLAILGILLIVLPPVGFIVSLVAGRKSARHGKPSALAAFGVIANGLVLLILTIWVVSFFKGGRYIDPRTNDPVVSDQITFETMKKVNGEIHRYIDEKKNLPYDIDDLKTLPGFDAALLRDARGTSMELFWSPEGCNSMTTCKAYSLRAVGRKINKPMEITYDAVENRTYTQWVPEKKVSE